MIDAGIGAENEKRIHRTFACRYCSILCMPFFARPGEKWHTLSCHRRSGIESTTAYVLQLSGSGLTGACRACILLSAMSQTTTTDPTDTLLPAGTAPAIIVRRAAFPPSRSIIALLIG